MTLAHLKENPSHLSAQNFRSLLQAMAMPGTIETLVTFQKPTGLSDAMAATLLTLCDAETNLFLADTYHNDEIKQWVGFHLNAPITSAQDADFFIGSWKDLEEKPSVKTGTDQFPDRSATFIIDVSKLENTGLRLTGPGIKSHSFLSLPNAKPFTENQKSFPLGNDYYFCFENHIAAISRTTFVEDL